MRKTAKTYWLAVFAILLLFVALSGCGEQDVPLKTGELFRDDFNRLDSSKWWAVKGSSYTKDGQLFLESSPKHGAEVQSLQSFRYGSLEFNASSDQWAVDTSIGFEIWSGTVHQAIVVTNGHLGIINQGKGQEWYKSIPNWNMGKDSIGEQINVFKIVWSSRKVELLINGNSAITYQDNLIPDTKMKIRINSSNDYKDRIVVGYVSVMQ